MTTRREPIHEKWARAARDAIETARRAADRKQQHPDIWIVVTSSYRIEIDPASEESSNRAALLSSGDIAAAIDGIPAAHTEVGFRYATDGHQR